MLSKRTNLFAAAALALNSQEAQASPATDTKVQEALALSQLQDNTRPAKGGLSQISSSTKANLQMMSIVPGVENFSFPPSDFQTLAQVSEVSCTTSQDRNKASLQDFYALYAGNQLYSDQSFRPDSDTLYWGELGEGYIMRTYEPKIEWGRIKDQLSSNVSLFGSSGITPDDIRQGAIGNCWFMAGASAIAEIPGRMERIFLNNENKLSANGIYAVNIYTLGVPHTVIVDDWLPLRNWKDGQLTTFFAHIGNDYSIWGAVLEKAFAKYHGNYEHLNGGNPVHSVRTLIGAPYEMHFHFNGQYYGYENISVDELWAELTSHDGKNDIIQGGTPGVSDQVQNAYGLAMSHAYSVLGTKTLESNGQRLVKMRNPWGTETYEGAYSDSSAVWTDELLTATGHTIGNDGTFYMRVEDYHAQVEATFINLDTTGWTQAYFLKLDDQTDSPGTFSSCGSSCTKHRLTVTSEVAQKVYITAHTWDSRCVANSCEVSSSKVHSIKVGSSSYVRKFWSNYGDLQFDPIEFSAGSTLQIEAEWNFSDSRIAKDWSIVAWGENGPLSVTHNGGLESDHLPYIERVQGSADTEIDINPEELVVVPDDADVPLPVDETTQEVIDAGHSVEHEPYCQYRFTEYCEAYTPGRATLHSECSAGIYEQGEEFFDGFRYMTVMMNTCEDWSKLYTVYMHTEDWFRTEHWYTVYNDNGGIVQDSVIKECHPDEFNSNILGCTFELGYIDNFERKGLTQAHQPRAGWQTAAGDFGILWYTEEWVKKPRPATQ